MNDQDVMTAHPALAPTHRLLWTAVVDIADKIDLGQGPLGHRYIVPILGGRFYGGPGIDGLEGEVLAGGADRQLVRPDGVKELEALYEMRAENGAVLTVLNQVIVDESQPERYAMSVIKVTAPEGPLEWLNRRLILGTLQSARPDRQAVIIRGWDAAPATQ